MKELTVAAAALSNKYRRTRAKWNFYFKFAGGEVQLTAEDVEIITEDMPGWLTANEGNLPLLSIFP
jgi:isoleucyl-tRNA synthetase